MNSSIAIPRWQKISVREFETAVTMGVSGTVLRMCVTDAKMFVTKGKTFAIDVRIAKID